MNSEVGLVGKTDDEIEAGFEALIAQGRVAIGETKKKKARTANLTPDLRQVIENKREYQWHLQPQVKLVVEDCECLNCGEKYQMPDAVYLFYKATTKKLIGRTFVVVSGGTKWKRAAPTDTMPENPERLVEHVSTKRAACQRCWIGKDLKDIAALQPPDLTVANSPAAIDLNAIFNEENTSVLVPTAAK